MGDSPRTVQHSEEADGIRPRGYAFGGYRLELHKRRLIGPDGVPLALPSRAYDVLAHLVEHRGRVVSKDELMKAAWPKSVVEENNLNQAISAARRALGDSRDEPTFILTIAGRGYRFVAETEPLREAVSHEPRLSSAEFVAPAALDIARDARLAGRRRLLLLGLGGAGAVVASAAWWALRRRPASRLPRSIAVLPFRPLLPETRNPAMELSITELLVNRLSRVHGLVVTPLSSVMRFGGPEADPLAAGRELRVEAVVDARLHLQDSRVRLTARLLSVDDGASLWAQSFTEQHGDLLAVQDALALQLADAITTQLSDEERVGVVARETVDIEAWQLYANGRLLVEQHDAAGLGQAIGYFEAALRRDSRFALASAGLSDAHALTAVLLLEPPARAFGKAREAALRALQLDPRMADAHIALGHVATELDRDLAAARGHYGQALKLKPDSARAHALLALNLTQSGDLPSAREAIRKAQLFEPAHYAYLSLSGFIGYFERAFDDSERELARLVASVPQAVLARHFLAYTMLVRRKGAEVLRLLEGRSANAPTAHATLARAYVQTGNLDGVQREMARLDQLSAQGFGVEYALALVHVELGQHDRALDQLERAGREAAMLGYLNVDPALDPIRRDVRFRRVAQRLRLT